MDAGTLAYFVNEDDQGVVRLCDHVFVELPTVHARRVWDVALCVMTIVPVSRRGCIDERQEEYV